MTKVVIIGFGNIGRGVYDSILQNEDLELAGILSRGPQRVENEFEEKNLPVPVLGNANAELDFQKEIPADVAILCGGSKDDLPVQGPKFARYYNTVDSFDTHDDIPEYYNSMDSVAKDNGNISIISTGWDPGTFSEERVKADAFLPDSEIYTFWGKGVSQGHSDAARQVEGVKDARQYTIPIKEAIEKVRSGERPQLSTRAKHRRLVYVVVQEEADRDRIKAEIKNMPAYYEPYATEVRFIDAQSMAEEHSEMPHGGFVMGSGETGRRGNKALIEYNCEWGSNPEATANILTAYARAARRLNDRGECGARSVLQVAAADVSIHSHVELLKKFV